MEMEPLKPCPFCGNPKPRIIGDIELVPSAIYCSKCNMYVSFLRAVDRNKPFGEIQEKITELWNRRAVRA